MAWEKFNENYDMFNGGALYVRDNEDGTSSAAGWLWMDGTEDDLPYFALICKFKHGETTYGDILVENKFDAAEAFSGAVDEDIEEEIGWFATPEEAEQIIEDSVSYDLA